MSYEKSQKEIGVGGYDGLRTERKTKVWMHPTDEGQSRTTGKRLRDSYDSPDTLILSQGFLWAWDWKGVDLNPNSKPAHGCPWVKILGNRLSPTSHRAVENIQG